MARARRQNPRSGRDHRPRQSRGAGHQATDERYRCSCRGEGRWRTYPAKEGPVGRHVSRETLGGTNGAWEVLRAMTGWTPIAEEAERATRVLHPAEPFPRPTRRRVLTVADPKGGGRKSTSAVELAAALAMHG